MQQADDDINRLWDQWYAQKAHVWQELTQAHALRDVDRWNYFQKQWEFIIWQEASAFNAVNNVNNNSNNSDSSRSNIINAHLIPAGNTPVAPLAVTSPPHLADNEDESDDNNDVDDNDKLKTTGSNNNSSDVKHCKSCNESMKAGSLNTHHRRVHQQHTTAAGALLSRDPSDCKFACPFPNCQHRHQDPQTVRRHVAARHPGWSTTAPPPATTPAVAVQGLAAAQNLSSAIRANEVHRHTAAISGVNQKELPVSTRLLGLQASSDVLTMLRDATVLTLPARHRSRVPVPDEAEREDEQLEEERDECHLLPLDEADENSGRAAPQPTCIDHCKLLCLLERYVQEKQGLVTNARPTLRLQIRKIAQLDDDSHEGTGTGRPGGRRFFDAITSASGVHKYARVGARLIVWLERVLSASANTNGEVVQALVDSFRLHWRTTDWLPLFRVPTSGDTTTPDTFIANLAERLLQHDDPSATMLMIDKLFITFASTPSSNLVTPHSLFELFIFSLVSLPVSTNTNTTNTNTTSVIKFVLDHAKGTQAISASVHLVNCALLDLIVSVERRQEDNVNLASILALLGPSSGFCDIIVLRKIMAMSVGGGDSGSNNNRTLAWVDDARTKLLVRGDTIVGLGDVSKACASLQSRVHVLLLKLLLLQDQGITLPLLHHHPWLTIQPSLIRDRNIPADGYSFINDPKNHKHLPNWHLWMQHFVAGQLVTMKEEGLVIENEQKTLQYLRDADELVDCLLAYVHLTSGAPSRGTELLTLHVLHSPGVARNIFWRHRSSNDDDGDGDDDDDDDQEDESCIEIVPRYNKNDVRLQHESGLARFIPPTMSKLILYYLACIRPVVGYLTDSLLTLKKNKANNNNSSAPPSASSTSSNLLFPLTPARLYSTFSIRLFEAMPHLPSAKVLTLSTTRHLLTALMREHVAETNKSCATTQVQAAQSGHGVQTSLTTYGRTPATENGGLPMALAESFFQFSRSWWKVLRHHLPSSSSSSNHPKKQNDTADGNSKLNTAQRQGADDDVIPSHDDDDYDHRNMHAAAAAADQNKNTTAGTNSNNVNSNNDKTLLQALRQVLRQSDADWKSEQQLQATKAILSSAATNSDCLVVLPTAVGKTVCLLTASHLENAGRLVTTITVVVLPLAALLVDMFTRCRGLGIDCAIFSNHPNHPNRYIDDASKPVSPARLTLLLASVETASTASFQQHLHSLMTDGRLSRIVLDEVHLYLTWGSFRSSINAIGQIRSRPSLANVPMVGLTATLPSALTAPLLQKVGMRGQQCVIVRQPCLLPRTEYVLKDLGATWEMTEALVAEIQRTTAKTMVFCPTRGLVRQVAATLTERLAASSQPVLTYTGAMDSSSKGRTWLKFCSNPTDKAVLVCTCAAGLGVSCDSVRLVITYGACSSLLQYAQDSGRGGRDGQPSRSVIITSEDSRRQFEQCFLRRGDNNDDADDDDDDDDYGASGYNTTNNWQVKEDFRQWSRMVSDGGCIRRSLSKCLDDNASAGGAPNRSCVEYIREGMVNVVKCNVCAHGLNNCRAIFFSKAEPPQQEGLEMRKKWASVAAVPHNNNNNNNNNPVIIIEQDNINHHHNEDVPARCQIAMLKNFPSTQPGTTCSALFSNQYCAVCFLLGLDYKDHSAGYGAGCRAFTTGRCLKCWGDSTFTKQHGNINRMAATCRLPLNLTKISCCWRCGLPWDSHPKWEEVEEVEDDDICEGGEDYVRVNNKRMRMATLPDQTTNKYHKANSSTPSKNPNSFQCTSGGTDLVKQICRIAFFLNSIFTKTIAPAFRLPPSFNLEAYTDWLARPATASNNRVSNLMLVFLLLVENNDEEEDRGRRRPNNTTSTFELQRRKVNASYSQY